METIALGERESLASASDPLPRRWPRVVAVVVVLVAVALGWADQQWQRAASDRLAAARAAMEQSAQAGRATVAGVRAYAGSALTSPEVDPTVRADLRELVRGAAERSAAEVESLVPERPILAGWHPEVDHEWRATRAQAAALASELRGLAR